MARPRSFDKDTVLNQVMVLFWEKGFSATSMADIQNATGLKPGSLYDTFGGKHELFLEAIDFYRNQFVRKRLDKLTRPGPARERLEEFFNELITISLGEGKRKGCLMSNTAVEMAPHDPAAREVVQENIVEIAEAFCEVVEDGVKSGEFTTKESPEDIARLLTTTLQGLRVMSKISNSEETLRTSARLALQVLG